MPLAFADLGQFAVDRVQLGDGRAAHAVDKGDDLSPDLKGRRSVLFDPLAWLPIPFADGARVGGRRRGCSSVIMR